MSDIPASIDEPMPGLRSYNAFLLGPDGSVEEARTIEAETDDEAKAIAAALVNGHGIDLWERARFLASFPALAERRAQD